MISRDVHEWAYQQLIQAFKAEGNWRTRELAQHAARNMTALARQIGRGDTWHMVITLHADVDQETINITRGEQ